MPYISLGKTTIDYLDYEDTFIISMILDTPCSYQYPVLVKDVTTMDVYFGTSFKEREFLSEMISLGATAYLYRPIEVNSPEVNWAEEIEELKNQGVPEELIPTNPEYLPSSLIIPENSPSWTNRDTLRLINSSQHNGYSFDYCYPKFNKDYSYTDKSGRKYILDLGGAEGRISNYKLDKGYETLAFRLDFSKVLMKDVPGSYIVVPYLGDNYAIWFSDGSVTEPKLNNIKSYLPIQISKSMEIEDLVESIKELLRSDYSVGEPYGLGYDVMDESDDGLLFTISKRRTNTFYNLDDIRVNIQVPERNAYYYELPNFSMTSDFRRTNDILSEATESIKQLEFYSKTIGKHEDDIKVSITKLEDEAYEYRIIVSRLSYQEYFEVNVSDNYKNNYAPLVSTINNNSKLVTCRLFDRITSLPEGEFYLRGSYVEDYTYENRRQALDIIKESDINDDVLIIDDLELWKSDANITGLDHKIFLDYATYKDNQVLITNRSYKNMDPLTGGFNTYHEHRYNLTDKDRWVENLLTVRNDLFCNIDVILNVGDQYEMMSDKMNRLVYFYNDMTYLGSYRPGCYIFLRGLLTDTYSADATKITYSTPDDRLWSEMDYYKSNFMVYDNHHYYYPRYRNGSTSRVSAVTRFIISKIGREFKRNKWNLVNMPVFMVARTVDKIIRDTLNRYSIIRSLELEDMSQNGNELTIKLVSEINELIVKDVVINITLNYNS